MSEIPPWDDEEAVAKLVSDTLFQEAIEKIRQTNVQMAADPAEHFKTVHKRRERSANEAWVERRDISPLADLVAGRQQLEQETWHCFSEALREGSKETSFLADFILYERSLVPQILWPVIADYARRHITRSRGRPKKPKDRRPDTSAATDVYHRVKIFLETKYGRRRDIPARARAITACLCKVAPSTLRDNTWKAAKTRG